MSRRRSSSTRPPSGLRRNLRALADPRVIGWRMFAISSVIFTIGALPIGGWASQQPAPVSWPAIVMTAASVQGVMFGLLALARLAYLGTAIARRHPACMVWTLILATFIANVAGAAVARSVSPYLGSVEPPEAFNAFWFQSVVLCLIGMAVSALQSHQREVTELERAQVVLIETRARAEQALEEVTAGQRADITVAVTSAIDSLTSAPTWESAARLQALSHEIVRPMSHELTALPADFAPDFRVDGRAAPWTRVLGDVVAVPLIAPVLMATLVTGLAIAFTVRTGGDAAPSESDSATMGAVTMSIDLVEVVRGVANLAIVFLATWLSAVLLRRITAPLLSSGRPAKKWTISVASILLIGVLAQFLTIAALRLLNLPPLPGETLWARILLLAPIAFVATTMSVIRAISLRHGSVIADLATANNELDWEVARTNEELWLRRMTLARALHGPLQASLNAAAIQLSVADSNGTVTPELIGRLQGSLHAALDTMTEQPNDPLTLMNSVEQVRQMWQDLCQVDDSIGSEFAQLLEGDPLCTASLTEIIGEACANAVIHGHATVITIRARTISDRLVRLTVEDNGSMAASVRRGLGTTLIDEVSVAWSLVGGDDGSTLQVTLPFASASTVCHRRGLDVA